MIVSDDFACETCRHPHRFRIYVGHDAFQKHAIHCRQCGELIEIGMENDYKTLTNKMVPLSNCVPCAPESSASIVTLHPEMVFPGDLQGQPYAFPWLFEFARIRHENPEYVADMGRLKRPSHEVHTEWERSGRLPPGPLHDWKFAKSVWSLFTNGRHDTCAEYIAREYENYRFTEVPDAFRVIYSFCALVGGRRAADVFKILQEVGEIARDKNSQQLEDLRDYYVQRFSNNLLRGSLDTISEYMSHYTEYAQVMIYQESGVEIDRDVRPSSTSFKDTKMFYGNAFEHLSTHLVLPACLNNIIHERPYDSFEDMTVDKYLILDKARKAEPFQDNPRLRTIAAGLDNKLRNASHHGDLQFDPNTATINYPASRKTVAALYGSGHPFNYRFLSYADYLVLCNNILQTIAGLTCFVIVVLRPEELCEEP